MSDFSALKRNRNAFDSLKKAMETPSSNAEAGSKDDTRFWQPEVDKAGNGMAVIRFLPAPAADGDDALPWVRVFNHGFQGPGGWYIENSLTTLNQKDPVSEYNSILWNSGIEANKEIARKQKRRLTYISNVLIVSDPKHPENEGQIKLYKYGKKIFDKISEAMNPEFADETPLNPFDFWEGANFKIKIRQVEGYRNYDKSEFDSPSALSDDDAKLEELWKKEYSLKEFLDPKQFKSYDTLKAKLDKVLGLDGVAPVKTKAEDITPAMTTMSPDLDDELDYFKSLAED
jgi:gp32 DNA binding protein like